MLGSSGKGATIGYEDHAPKNHSRDGIVYCRD